MATGQYRFAHFMVDATERRLWQDGLPVEINARYLDALLLLLSDPGTLITKERFFTEVWRGMAVTDEALTQCIRTLRRQLGDSATAPRFIETVPKYGYRFIAQVRHGDQVLDPTPLPVASGSTHSLLSALQQGGIGSLGGAVAGLVGGLCYGFIAAAQSVPNGAGALSAVLVLVMVSLIVAVSGALGVSFGIALMDFTAMRNGWRQVVGGAIGGLFVGGFAKLLGLDALQLLFGRAPSDITGGFEGLLVGAAVGVAVWLSSGDAPNTWRRSSVKAAACGGAAGLGISLVGGRLLTGSLAELARNYPESRLRLALFQDESTAFVGQALMAAFEVALFSACIVAALRLAQARRENRL